LPITCNRVYFWNKESSSRYSIRFSNLNLGFEYGKKGTTDNGLLEEKYVNFRLSLSLNDIWFKKRKID